MTPSLPQFARIAAAIVTSQSSTPVAPSGSEAVGLPIQIVQLGTNADYAAGLKAGVDALAGREPDAVLVINPDCRLRPRTLRAMADALPVPPRRIVAPRSLNHDGTQPTLRRMPTIGGAFAEALMGRKLASRVGLGDLGFVESSQIEQVQPPGPLAEPCRSFGGCLSPRGDGTSHFLLHNEDTEL
jgi:N-acetylglucosaminyl-diphospho-decaprenol L-rhamnosyltransferase